MGPTVISGVIPTLAVKADHLPVMSETGIGALMPWAGRLWFITYTCHKSATGAGTGLFSVDDDLALTKHPESVVGTYANRFVHKETEQLMIGPHVIDTEGNIRTVDELVDHRLTATCAHRTDPANKVHVLGMEGEFFELDMRTLEVTHLADLLVELDVPGYPHFKDACTTDGVVVVVNNSYYHHDFPGSVTDDDAHPDRGRGGKPGGVRGDRGVWESQGRLAEWDGDTWRVIERTQFNTLATANGMGDALFAVGQDPASALLCVRIPGVGWQRYRLPKATHTQDHAFTTEWPRIREVESERLLMDASGMFYELPSMTYADKVWGLRPISSHLRVVGDFCSWNGLLVMAGDQTTPLFHANPVAGQAQAGLWFGKTDDLWGFGKPAGWGGPWWESPVKAGEPSDPYLMTGFEHKGLHVSHDAGTAVEVQVEVDFMGTGVWHRAASVEVGESGYAFHAFPAGFSAHWIRLVSSRDCIMTAQLVYT